MLDGINFGDKIGLSRLIRVFLRFRPPNPIQTKSAPLGQEGIRIGSLREVDAVSTIGYVCLA